jgi:hypothetical protein
MAYMSQDRKAELARGIAKAMPDGWKYSLAVRDHSTLVLTIRQADVDLIGENMSWRFRAEPRPTYIDLNEYHLNGHYSGKLLKIFEGIKDAMMVGNHDNSDPQTDYFDVGWYIDINIGNGKSPFLYLNKKNPVRDTTTPRPNGMPEGLTEAQEIMWMKNRIVELEAR